MMEREDAMENTEQHLEMKKMEKVEQAWLIPLLC